MVSGSHRDQPRRQRRAGIGNRAGKDTRNVSAFSAPPNGRNVLQQKTLGAEENPLCYTWLKSRDSRLAKTSHIHRAVLEHRAARLGVYERAACREVRFVIY